MPSLAPILYSNKHPGGNYLRGALINKIQIKGGRGSYSRGAFIREGALIRAFTVTCLAENGKVTTVFSQSVSENNCLIKFNNHILFTLSAKDFILS